MKLELATFKVSNVEFADGNAESRYSDGLLRLNRRRLLEVLRDDPRLARVDVEIASPAEAARILPVHDVIEPRVKIAGPGVVFPGVASRSAIAVGRGRTNRLAGVAVVECAPLPPLGGTPGWEGTPGFYLDTQGPASVPPYAGLSLLVVLADPREDISPRDRSEAAWTAALKAAVYAAETTLRCSPHQVDVFDEEPVAPELPAVVYMPLYNSPEHYGGSRNSFGLSIYGNTDLTSPWLLHPNEYLDGAVLRTGSWIHENQPQINALRIAHGRSLRFAGIIAQRTRWTAETEKRLTAHQAAKMAKMLGAEGALITWDYGGNDFLEVAYTVEACEELGIKTVFITHEQAATHPFSVGQFLFLPDAANAVVSTGTLTLGEVTKPARVIGFDDGVGALDFTIPAPGREVFGYDDRYGIRHLSKVDF